MAQCNEVRLQDTRGKTPREEGYDEIKAAAENAIELIRTITCVHVFVGFFPPWVWSRIGAALSWTNHGTDNEVDAELKRPTR